ALGVAPLMAEATWTASFMFMPELAQPDRARARARPAKAGCLIESSSVGMWKIELEYRPLCRGRQRLVVNRRVSRRRGRAATGCGRGWPAGAVRPLPVADDAARAFPDGWSTR